MMDGDSRIGTAEWLEHYVNGKVCALCRSAVPLRESHIIPAFVFRWLKETGASDYLRSSQAPNRRVQDGLKVPLLCEGCEQMFSRDEAEFAGKLFFPFASDNDFRASYGTWYSRFCVSVSWRVLVYHLRQGMAAKLNEVRLAGTKRALETWEAFLFGKLPHPGVFEQHVLPLSGIASSNIPRMPDNINRYFRRGVEFDFPMGEGSPTAMTFSKLGPFAIFGFVVPPNDRWRGTRVSVNGGRFGPREFRLPKAIGEYLFWRADKNKEVSSAISITQQNKIAETVEGNIERLRSSASFTALLEDYEMFGEDAILYKGG